jgi:hypothetical protein
MFKHKLKILKAMVPSRTNFILLITSKHGMKRDYTIYASTVETDSTPVNRK